MCGRIPEVTQEFPSHPWMDYKICETCVTNVALPNTGPEDRLIWRVKDKKWFLYDVVRGIPERQREYWYYWVWTLAPNHSIEEVRANIDKFVACDLGIYYCDISFEHGEETGREHYNMRIRSHKCIKAQRVKRYEKAGKINRQTIRKQTESNWDNVGNYCSKENEIEVLVDQ